jgi:hypothetical protein
LSKGKKTSVVKLNGGVSFSPPLSHSAIVFFDELRNAVRENTQKKPYWRAVISTWPLLTRSGERCPYSVELQHKFQEGKLPQTTVLLRDVTSVFGSLSLKYTASKKSKWDSLRRMSEVVVECVELGLVVVGKITGKKGDISIVIELGKQHVGYVLCVVSSPTLPDIYRIFQHSNYAPGGLLAAVCAPKVFWVAPHADPRVMVALSVILNLFRMCLVGTSASARQVKEMKTALNTFVSRGESEATGGEGNRFGVGVVCELVDFCHEMDCCRGFDIPSIGEKSDPLAYLGSIADFNLDGAVR